MSTLIVSLSNVHRTDSSIPFVYQPDYKFQFSYTTIISPTIGVRHYNLFAFLSLGTDTEVIGIRVSFSVYLGTLHSQTLCRGEGNTHTCMGRGACVWNPKLSVEKPRL